MCSAEDGVADVSSSNSLNTSRMRVHAHINIADELDLSIPVNAVSPVLLICRRCSQDSWDQARG